jgi:hypothetical protein
VSRSFQTTTTKGQGGKKSKKVGKKVRPKERARGREGTDDEENSFPSILDLFLYGNKDEIRG